MAIELNRMDRRKRSRRINKINQKPAPLDNYVYLIGLHPICRYLVDIWGHHTYYRYLGTPYILNNGDTKSIEKAVQQITKMKATNPGDGLSSFPAITINNQHSP
jgi:hypothetical protein